MEEVALNRIWGNEQTSPKGEKEQGDILGRVTISMLDLVEQSEVEGAKDRWEDAHGVSRWLGAKVRGSLCCVKSQAYREEPLLLLGE